MSEEKIIAVKQNVFLIPFFAHVLNQLNLQYSGFFDYPVLYYVLVLWLADFVSGLTCAVIDTYCVKKLKIDIPNANILSASKMARSVSKFMLLIVVVLTTFTMKKNGLFLASTGSIVETLIIITQSASIFRNCGKAAKMEFLRNSAEYLESFSENKLNKMKEEVESKNGHSDRT